MKLTQKKLENAFKQLIGMFIVAGFSKDQAIEESERALKNGDFEEMIKSALIQM